MQRGCANNNISLSILLYASSLSLLIQLLQRIVSTSITLNVVSSYRQHRHIASIGDCIHLIGYKAAFDSSTDTNFPNIESTNKKILECVWSTPSNTYSFKFSILFDFAAKKILLYLSRLNSVYFSMAIKNKTCVYDNTQ